MADTDRRCERCFQRLDPAKAVELELDQGTGLYHRPGQLPEGAESQGMFDFGAACARRVLRNGGACDYQD